jgi:hypothetical protein
MFSDMARCYVAASTGLVQWIAKYTIVTFCHTMPFNVVDDSSSKLLAAHTVSLLLLFMRQQLATQRTASWDAKLQLYTACAHSSYRQTVAVAVVLAAVAATRGVAMTSHCVLLWLLCNTLAP